MIYICEDCGEVPEEEVQLETEYEEYGPTWSYLIHFKPNDNWGCECSVEKLTEQEWLDRQVERVTAEAFTSESEVSFLKIS